MNLEIPIAVVHVFILVYTMKLIDDTRGRSHSVQKTELKSYDVCMKDFGGETYYKVAT